MRGLPFARQAPVTLKPFVPNQPLPGITVGRNAGGGAGDRPVFPGCRREPALCWAARTAGRECSGNGFRAKIRFFRSADPGLAGLG